MEKHRKNHQIFLKIMKLSFQQFFVAILFTSVGFAHSNAQSILEKKISLYANKRDIKSVLKDIENSVGVRFTYVQSLIPSDKVISINFNNEKLDVILNNLLKPHKIVYEVNDKYIILSKQLSDLKLTETKTSDIDFEQSIAINISGKVVDDKGAALQGVNIVIKGTNIGDISNSKGEFNISVPNNQSILVFSYVGFETQEIQVGNQTKINITLKTDIKAIDEVVVVGYGSQKKTSVTGAVASVSQKDLKALPVAGLTQAIQGRVAGVSITNNSSPGTEPIIRIRGVGSISLNPNPLYVIDGIPFGALNSVDPKDIESLEILKDASAAAIYGSRASNGVILITTKKGKSGKISINVDSYYGTQSVWKELDLLNRDQYIKYGTTLLSASGQAVPERFNNLNTPIYPGATTSFAQTDTDWQKTMFRNAVISDHQVSISGGNDFSRFYTSIGYFNQEGILSNTNYNRHSFRINSDHKLSKYITVGQTLVASTSFNTSERDGGGRSLVMNIMRMVPYWPERDPTKIGGFSTTAQGLDATDPENPLRIAEQEQQNQTGRYFKFIGSLFTEIKLTNWLKYKFTAGLDYSHSRFNGFLPIYNDGNRSRDLAIVSEDRNEYFSKILTNQITFDKTFGKHFVNLTGVIETQDAASRGLRASGQRPDNNIQTIQGVSNQNGSSTLFENSLISYVGRLNYEYAGKYLVGATIRRDGSSKFAPGRKWGTFPSLALGWRISEEPFMKDITAISELKIRGSIGKTGFNSIGDYDYSPLVSAGNTLYPFGNKTQSGSYFNRLGNTDLTWETTTMRNVGLDISLLNNKINITTELYNRQTDKLLLGVPLPESLGYSQSPLANVGSMQNYGFEFSAGYNYSSKDFNWNLNAVIDFTRNKVLSLATPNSTIYSGANSDFGGFDITRTEAGQPIQSFYGWQTDGIFQNKEEIDAANSKDGNPSTFYQNASTSPGDIRFKDLNNDGKIDADDRTYLGSYLPNFSFGLNWSGTYKNFDFTLYFQGVQGNKIYNGSKVIGQGMLRLFNATTDVLNAWTPQNTNTDIPRAVSGDPNQNTRTSDRFLEDGSYIRLKNLSIGYTIPPSYVGKLSGNVLNKVRIYISTQNLLTFTKYTGYDPEVASKYGALLTNGVDYGQYPQARTVIVGLNLGF